jgi:hypothetical protein
MSIANLAYSKRIICLTERHKENYTIFMLSQRAITGSLGVMILDNVTPPADTLQFSEELLISDLAIPLIVWFAVLGAPHMPVETRTGSPAEISQHDIGPPIFVRRNGSAALNRRQYHHKIWSL